MEIGENGIRSVIGKTFQNMVLKHLSEVIPLPNMRIIVHKRIVAFNPNQLFPSLQRILLKKMKIIFKTPCDTLHSFIR